MAYEAKRIGVAKGLGDIYHVAAPLDQQLIAFADKGIQYPFLLTSDEVVSMRLDGIFEVSGARVNTNVSDDFTRTSLMLVVLKDEPTILYKPSVKIKTSFMDPEIAVAAVNSIQMGEYFQAPKGFYEEVRDIAKAEEGLAPEDRIAHIILQRGDLKLNYAMNETRFLLGRRAKEYFEAKKHPQIPFYSLSATFKDSASVNCLGFNSPQNGSNFNCRSRGLGNDIGTFGLLRNSAEGSAQ